jgi:hypothetical protein
MGAAECSAVELAVGYYQRRRPVLPDGSSNSQNRRPWAGPQHDQSERIWGVKVAANTWAHLAATYDGTTIRLYVNGVQVATGAQTAAISTSTSALAIGANFYGEYFNGLIDEVRIYNRALTGCGDSD